MGELGTWEGGVDGDDAVPSAGFETLRAAACDQTESHFTGSCVCASMATAAREMRLHGESRPPIWSRRIVQWYAG